ncbi:hypothetical protein [Desulfovibrio sp. 3_1_syn3]|uniref:hypothetical protein n=1 Tax=Desulfovibrio sp. 3_1_syn3 TaxID=457398 RepID=UPI0005592A47|nr:hypothetical protein [Desulfovibrio sp. 3_1_syn3]
MYQVRDKNTQLSAQEIEAIKVTQEIIKRMADNSQKIKNYFLVACVIFFALLGRGVVCLGLHTYLAFCILTLTFWIMDAKYLRLERQFREHHKAIVLGTKPYLDDWDFNPSGYQVPSTIRTMFTFSQLLYPAMIIILFLIA